jgi:hypothetical protein
MEDVCDNTFDFIKSLFPGKLIQKYIEVQRSGKISDYTITFDVEEAFCVCLDDCKHKTTRMFEFDDDFLEGSKFDVCIDLETTAVEIRCKTIGCKAHRNNMSRPVKPNWTFIQTIQMIVMYYPRYPTSGQPLPSEKLEDENVINPGSPRVDPWKERLTLNNVMNLATEKFVFAHSRPKKESLTGRSVYTDASNVYKSIKEDLKNRQGKERIKTF